MVIAVYCVSSQLIMRQLLLKQTDDFHLRKISAVTHICDGSCISANPGGIIGSGLAYILLPLVVWSSGGWVPEALMRVPGGDWDGQG